MDTILSFSALQDGLRFLCSEYAQLALAPALGISAQIRKPLNNRSWPSVVLISVLFLAVIFVGMVEGDGLLVKGGFYLFFFFLAEE